MSDPVLDEADLIVVPDERPPLNERFSGPALALGAGALLALSLPPWGFWPLAFVGIILFDITLGDAPTRKVRRRRGWLFGAGWMFLGMGWMIQLTGPGYVVAAAIFAGLHGVAASISPTGPWRVFGRPAAHALVEALRFSFPFGGVPLATLGMSQVGGPLAGVASIGGVILLTWLTFQIGFALAAVFTGQSVAGPRPFDRVAAAALVACVVIIGASIVAPSGTDTGETLRIAVVQGGGEQGTSALDVPSIVVTERHLAATATIEPDPDLDLVLWPENTIDVVTFETSDVVPLITAEAARLGVPIAVGLTEDVRIDGKRRFTNAQVVITPDGEIVSRYDKVRRVPFGEYVPLRSTIERISSAVDRVGDAVAGTTPAVLDLPTGERLAVVISWEVFFGGRAREGVALGAEVVANPTNGASYTGTIVQTQQVASSRLRAIETGRWVVQAAPTGFSAFVDADGTVVERTSQREQIVITRDVPLRSGTTWYVELGDRPFIIGLLVVLAGAWIMTRWRDHQVADDEDFGLPPADSSAVQLGRSPLSDETEPLVKPDPPRSASMPASSDLPRRVVNPSRHLLRY
ncbi:MAG: apolipoprotein N-acyltransferase [Candidatus Aldehydirespiratoraceae bacterium]